MAAKNYVIIWLVASFLVWLTPTPSHCADPDPLQDFCPADLNSPNFVNGFPCRNPSTVTSDDFFFDGFNRVKGTQFDLFGLNSTFGEVTTFPGLNTQGIAQNRIRIRAGGINQPHIHPRATELSRMDEGALFVGIITTAGKFYSKIARKGEMFVVPRGLLHFELNIAKETATFFASFNSQNPGVIRVSGNFCQQWSPSLSARRENINTQ
ncbi:OLC1v1025649C2 [Oldenlandia corymbosa var. corymbosa]|uniref:Germin-like protein n=1 Tax=Oldenlandia corymbosa var. corymbosa TaxID=529605 RepID=A0AAV1C5M4_OLDCO|nr:OLC1v1025649C2 [Oldenlandia corymbosa var. corymbosa]